MTENELATTIVDCAFKVHKALGPGLLETIYQAALAYEITQRGLKVEVERGIPAYYGEVKL